ncbi:hypothetical protein C0J52_19800 [Blattella germanica]|nr:hypothetical protein C0J52_19800 [Blattella germanica]
MDAMCHYYPFCFCEFGLRFLRLVLLSRCFLPQRLAFPSAQLTVKWVQWCSSGGPARPSKEWTGNCLGECYSKLLTCHYHLSTLMVLGT